jgi:hypothetical protein
MYEVSIGKILFYKGGRQKVNYGIRVKWRGTLVLTRAEQVNNLPLAIPGTKNVIGELMMTEDKLL